MMPRLFTDNADGWKFKFRKLRNTFRTKVLSLPPVFPDKKRTDLCYELHCQLTHQRDEQVYELLLEGADPNYTSKEGVHTLDIPIKQGRADILQLLLQAGAYPVLFQRRRTTLEMALEYCPDNKEILESLTNYKGLLTYRRHNKVSPLFQVAVKLRLDLVRLFIERGAPVSGYTELGMLRFFQEEEEQNRNPLLWACSERHEALIRCLLEATKDHPYLCFALDDPGHFYVAVYRSQRDRPLEPCIQALREYGIPLPLRCIRNHGLRPTIAEEFTRFANGHFYRMSLWANGYPVHKLTGEFSESERDSLGAMVLSFLGLDGSALESAIEQGAWCVLEPFLHSRDVLEKLYPTASIPMPDTEGIPPGRPLSLKLSCQRALIQASKKGIRFEKAVQESEIGAIGGLEDFSERLLWQYTVDKRTEARQGLPSGPKSSDKPVQVAGRCRSRRR